MVVAKLSMEGQKVLKFYQKRIFICVTKINKNLKGLERDEGE